MEQVKLEAKVRNIKMGPGYPTTEFSSGFRAGRHSEVQINLSNVSGAWANDILGNRCRITIEPVDPALEPCDFCGASGSFKTQPGSSGAVKVECNHCGATTHWATTKEIVAWYWNRSKYARMSLEDMAKGSQAYMYPWALYGSEGNGCWLRGDYPIFAEANGSAAMRVKRVMDQYVVYTNLVPKDNAPLSRDWNWVKVSKLVFEGM
jgi:hypothetical protein